VLVVAKQFTAKHAVGSLKDLDPDQSTIGIEIQYERGEGVGLVIHWPQRDRRVNKIAAGISKRDVCVAGFGVVADVWPCHRRQRCDSNVTATKTGATDLGPCRVRRFEPVDAHAMSSWNLTSRHIRR
jgi:hypothetical protein